MSGPAAEPPPPSPSGPLLHPLLRSGLFVFAFFAVQLLVAVALSLLLRATEGGGRGRPSEVVLFAFALTLPPLYLVTRLFAELLDRRPLAAIGLRLPAGRQGAPGRRRAALRQAVTAPLGALALLGAWLVLLLALPDRLARFAFLGVDAGFRHPPAWWPAPAVLLLALLLVGFTLQGWVEEWVFRGYVYRALRERWSPLAAAAISSLAFAALHLRNPEATGASLLNIFLAGMVLAGLVARTGSLWAASLAHGAWNFAVACLLSVPVSGYSLFHLLAVRVAGNPLLTGGGFGPEGSLLLAPLVALAAAALWRRTPRPPGAGADPTARPPAAAEGIPAGAPEATPAAGPCSAGSGAP